MKYRRTTLVYAEKYDGSEAMNKKYGIEFNGDWMMYALESHEISMPLEIGDYIVTNVDDKNDRWVVDYDIFKQTYEPVEEN